MLDDAASEKIIAYPQTFHQRTPLRLLTAALPAALVRRLVGYAAHWAAARR
jgi:hypothetical protein